MSLGDTRAKGIKRIAARVTSRRRTRGRAGFHAPHAAQPTYQFSRVGIRSLWSIVPIMYGSDAYLPVHMSRMRTVIWAVDTTNTFKSMYKLFHFCQVSSVYIPDRYMATWLVFNFLYFWIYSSHLKKCWVCFHIIIKME